MGCFEKVHGGYKVDGLELKAANCGCGGLTGPGGSRCEKLRPINNLTGRDRKTILRISRPGPVDPTTRQKRAGSGLVNRGNPKIAAQEPGCFSPPTS